MGIHNFETIKDVRSEIESNFFLKMAETAKEANADHLACNIYWFDEDKPEEIEEDFVAYYTLHVKRVRKC